MIVPNKAYVEKQQCVLMKYVQKKSDIAIDANQRNPTCWLNTFIAGTIRRCGQCYWLTVKFVDDWHGSGTDRCLTGRVEYGYGVHGSGIPVFTRKEHHFFTMLKLYRIVFYFFL